MEFSEIIRVCEQKKQISDILTLSKMMVSQNFYPKKVNNATHNSLFIFLSK